MGDILHQPPSDSCSTLPQPYEYASLQSPNTLRILCLEPAEARSNPLQASLIHVDRYAELVNNPQGYSAVSYAWGDPDFSERLSLLVKGEDGANYRCYLPITENVKTILLHLRKPHKRRYLWIDAICLNQNDDTEKAQQIPLMGEIYKQANRVHFWLGTEDGSDIANVFAYFRLLAVSPDDVPITKVFEDYETGASHIRKFFGRAWFFRRWILQEAALAHHGTVYCGSHSILYSRFASACQRLAKSQSTQQEYGVKMISTLAETERDICTLLWRLHQSACYDKRDRIAALYGLIPRNKQLTLEYARDYQYLYKHHAVSLANSHSQHSLILHLFDFGPVQAPSNTSFPSWVPDWSKKRNTMIPSLYTPPDAPDYQEALLIPAGLQSYESWRRTQGCGRIGSNNCSQEVRAWNEWLLAGAFAHRDKRAPPYTIFSVRADDSDNEKLNVSWVNQWGGLHGRAISEVIIITEEELGADGWLNLVRRFRPLAKNMNIKDSFAMHGGDSDNLGRLAVVIQTIMERHGSKTLVRWKPPQRGILVALALYSIFTDMELVGLRESTHTYFEELFNESGEDATEVVKGIIKEMCLILHEAKLVIAELEYEQHKSWIYRDGELDYVIGPSNLEVGMRLIPLASRLSNRINPEPQTTWRKLCRNGRLFRFSSALANMIVVKPETSGTQTITAPSRTIPDEPWETPPVLRDAVGQTLRAVPLKATYVGPCIGTISFTSTEALSTWIRDGYKRAESAGQPPPFTIDIV